MSRIGRKKRAEMGVEISIEERLDLIEKKTKEAEKLIRRSSEVGEDLYKKKVSEAIRAGGERSKLLIQIYERHAEVLLDVPVSVRLNIFEGNEQFQVLRLRKLLDDLKGGEK